MNFLLRIKKFYNSFFYYVAFGQSPFLLLVRLYWGWQLTVSGWGKLHHLDKVTEFFTSLALPMPAQTAVAISCLEFFGGILPGRVPHHIVFRPREICGGRTAEPLVPRPARRKKTSSGLVARPAPEKAKLDPTWLDRTSCGYKSRLCSLPFSRPAVRSAPARLK
jgi:hypothetical protein